MKERLDIVNIAAEAMGVSLSEVMEKQKKKTALYARYIIMGILREEGYNTNEIAELFKDWTRNSIANHCVKVFDELLSYNRQFKDMYLSAVKAVEEQQNDD